MGTILSPKQANEFFQKLGVEVAVAAEGEAGDETADIELLASGVFKDSEEKIRHDIGYEIREQAKKEEAGRQLGALRASLKRTFGIKEDEVSELSLDNMVKLAKERSVSSGDKAQTDYLSKLTEREREWESEKEQMAQSHQKGLSEMEEKFVFRDMKDRFTSLINDVPRKGGDPIKQAELLLSHVRSNFVTRINPQTKEIEFFEKENPEKRAFDGKQVITDKYYTKKFIADIGADAPDTRHIPPADIKNGSANARAGIITEKLESGDPMDFISKSFERAAREA